MTCRSCWGQQSLGTRRALKVSPAKRAEHRNKPVEAERLNNVRVAPIQAGAGHGDGRSVTGSLGVRCPSQQVARLARPEVQEARPLLSNVLMLSQFCRQQLELGAAPAVPDTQGQLSPSLWLCLDADGSGLA